MKIQNLNLQNIKDKNGGSFALFDELKNVNRLHRVGYMVSLQDFEIEVDALSFSNIEKILSNLDKKYFSNTEDEYYLGFWFNEKNEKWYIDVSKFILNKNKALVFGKENNQYSIYRIKGKKIIDLNVR